MHKLILKNECTYEFLPLYFWNEDDDGQKSMVDLLSKIRKAPPASYTLADWKSWLPLNISAESKQTKKHKTSNKLSHLINR